MGSHLAPPLASRDGALHRAIMSMVTAHLIWVLVLAACADVVVPSRSASPQSPSAGVSVPTKRPSCGAIHVETPAGVSACAAQGCMVVKARRESARGGCWEEEAPVGCVALRGCEDAVTLARDPAGKLHSFDDLCIPDGWREVPSGRDLPACAGSAAP